jgi:Vitamin B6 photo-protection and homoeostasis
MIKFCRFQLFTLLSMLAIPWIVDCFHLTSQTNFRKSRILILKLVEDFSIAEIDMRYNTQSLLRYDDTLRQFVTASDESAYHSNLQSVNGESMIPEIHTFKLLHKTNKWIRSFLFQSFFPDGVTPSYYRFVKYRVLQRFINSIVHVLGTQSLLLGLGFKSKALGLSAAMNWVLKDVLGKLVRLIWASRMGGRFDSDAKRWRYRSALVFALGNSLEIITFINPSFFLVWATLANCCKQVSMLTSSSTRTAIYNSFRTAENIADITAKGEAQIAVVDLLGITCGVFLSKAIGMNAVNVVGVYIALQCSELILIYRMIRAVEYRVLNFERMIQLIDKFVSAKMKNESLNLPTPAEMARSEKIFLPPAHLNRRANAFGSLRRAKLEPDELTELINIFNYDKFLLVVGQNVKNRKSFLSRDTVPGENCHVVLHANATSVDIVKSTLALSILRRFLIELPYSVRSRDCYNEIRKANDLCDKWFPSFLKKMSTQGWAPARFMFGRVTMRAVWPLHPKGKSARTNENKTIAIESEK